MVYVYNIISMIYVYNLICFISFLILTICLFVNYYNITIYKSDFSNF